VGGLCHPDPGFRELDRSEGAITLGMLRLFGRRAASERQRS
jgi:hypothetical protein